MTHRIARCRSCKAEILWGLTIHDKRMPLDHEPVSLDEAVATKWRGLFTFIDGTEKIAAAGPLEPGLDLHRSHFASCPAAGKHRKAA